jgi:hypothetical protein
MAKRPRVIPQIPGEPVADAPVAAVAPQDQAIAAEPAADQPTTLPHQDDVDPTKISTPVLTQQGYVVPVKLEG